jgi:hypothetical protein
MRCQLRAVMLLPAAPVLLPPLLLLLPLRLLRPHLPPPLPLRVLALLQLHRVRPRASARCPPQRAQDHLLQPAPLLLPRPPLPSLPRHRTLRRGLRICNCLRALPQLRALLL